MAVMVKTSVISVTEQATELEKQEARPGFEALENLPS